MRSRGKSRALAVRPGCAAQVATRFLPREMGTAGPSPSSGGLRVQRSGGHNTVSTEWSAPMGSRHWCLLCLVGLAGSVLWEVPGAGQEGSRKASAPGAHQGLLASFLPSDGEHGLLRGRGAALPEDRAPLLRPQLQLEPPHPLGHQLLQPVGRL